MCRTIERNVRECLVSGSLKSYVSWQCDGAALWRRAGSFWDGERRATNPGRRGKRAQPAVSVAAHLRASIYHLDWLEGRGVFAGKLPRV